MTSCKIISTAAKYPEHSQAKNTGRSFHGQNNRKNDLQHQALKNRQSFSCREQSNPKKKIKQKTSVDLLGFLQKLQGTLLHQRERGNYNVKTDSSNQ